jgi:glutaredoxin-like YruB-family protein
MTAAARPDVVVYTTPTCPWCVRAKDFLRKEGVEFETRDVSVDRPAATEMMRRTHQTGVPVIADADEAIVGFDLPRLQQLAARHRKAPTLGVQVADAVGAGGARVGGVRPDSPAGRAGVAVGDTIVELSGRPVTSVADLEATARRRAPGQPTSLSVRRGETQITLILP